jgi:hypothetical protein
MGQIMSHISRGYECINSLEFPSLNPGFIQDKIKQYHEQQFLVLKGVPMLTFQKLNLTAPIRWYSSIIF